MNGEFFIVFFSWIEERMRLESESESLTEEVADVSTMMVFEMSDEFADERIEAEQDDTAIQRTII